MKQALILGIETSCDETGIALVAGRRNADGYQLDVREHLLHSQVKTHAKTGGVVPEVAAREHAVRLPKLLQELTKRHPRLEKQVDAVAVTNGPGLLTSLLVGIEVARTIAFAWKKPLVPVNHLEGHVYANLLTDLRNDKFQISNVKSNPNDQSSKRKNQTLTFAFPLLVLIVSGGHTELVLMRDHMKYKLLGETRDDAAGEAFDKTAKLLGLPYPGGPALSRLAVSGKPTIALPRPMMTDPTFDFSFSGLKTATALAVESKMQKLKVKNANQKSKVWLQTKADLAASIETAIVEVLVTKTLRGIAKHKPKTIALAGGVAANRTLREELRQKVNEKFPEVIVLEPKIEYATDNAAMIAGAGAVRYLNGFSKTWDTVKADPQLPLR